ncbi:DUF504 domain-containing protein [Candidatus Woesearchaeota archaeon]|nr:DUF504 domain-containing protein [Candidatus Woesearchaeota archaeon]
MQSILELINKIRWDKREKPEEYTFYYLDRITNEHKAIRFAEIKRIEGNFLYLERDGEETAIPLHRIKYVKRGNEIIWQR